MTGITPRENDGAERSAAGSADMADAALAFIAATLAGEETLPLDDIMPGLALCLAGVSEFESGAALISWTEEAMRLVELLEADGRILIDERNRVGLLPAIVQVTRGRL